jgi:hypothetical protein
MAVTILDSMAVIVAIIVDFMVWKVTGFGSEATSQEEGVSSEECTEMA